MSRPVQLGALTPDTCIYGVLRSPPAPAGCSSPQLSLFWQERKVKRGRISRQSKSRLRGRTLRRRSRRRSRSRSRRRSKRKSRRRMSGREWEEICQEEPAGPSTPPASVPAMQTQKRPLSLSSPQPLPRPKAPVPPETPPRQEICDNVIAVGADE